MSVSQNGYPACASAPLGRYTVPGTHFTMVMRRGATATVLLYYVQRWLHEIEPITIIGCYSCRGIPGSSSLSNHASGTAVDINWDKWPYGSHPSAHVASIVHNILATRIGGIRVGSILRWGGDYQHSTLDVMHIEINAPLAPVTALANAILSVHPPKPPPPTKKVHMEWIAKTRGSQFSAHFICNGIIRKHIESTRNLDSIKERLRSFGLSDHVYEYDPGEIASGIVGVIVGPDADPGTY